ncbi:enamine deaminase RidA (YjgF/YER057c/UK114 family) [Hoeflea halophila]|uniref:Enamine deaminase RidA (YjgF/YER057c/UK114 family) n=1 Tax=Hoeflea halophila TaxID=714899 RepID=A0A286ID59_9HYPH|nr:RidA family protein [Hoeflea halophila]SOE18050.1 enamine deaminase RidA (YjgF/YER057c/UK114 family) [Hoeflea halophila]
MSDRRKHSTGSPFEKAAAYSRAIRQGPFVHVSGTTGYDYTAMEMPADVADQARNCFTTIAASLAAVDASLSDVVRVRYYVTKPEHFDAVAPVLKEHLAGIDPAATMIVCQLIRPEMLIEIEVTAQVS